MYTIRKMTRLDIEPVGEIEAISFGDPWSKKSMEDIFTYGDNHYYVAIEDNRIIGFAGIMKVLDEADLVNIAVNLIYRGKGVGKLLMEEILHQSKELNIAKITLEVRASNFSAIRMYNKFDFVHIATRKDYYVNPIENALIMQREL